MANIIEQTKEIRKIWSAYQSSRVLITANNFRVFDYLEKPMTAGTLAKKIKTDCRATEILLDALAGTGLLKKQKDRYKNTSLASRLLVHGKPLYQGDIIRHAEHMWRSWSHLDAAMKTGKPSGGKRDHESFILGMHNLSVLKVKDIVKEIDLAGVRTALDLGGGPGTYSIELAKKGIQVTLFDTPETIKLAKRVINNSPQSPLRLRGGEGGVKKNISFIQGDFLHDDIGTGYDLIFVSQILHAYSDKDNMSLLRKCRKALNSSGRVVVQEFLIDESRTKPVQGALFAINMLVNTDGGRTYSPGEMKRWMLKTGFKDVDHKMVADGVLVRGKK
ncbi:MAG: methyltransferase domain-containing protein [Nitrospiraceae bacterium]|nr:MAG: methyltransferase domain-containing protein [Nitrospiraceae bacterium]